MRTDYGYPQNSRTNSCHTDNQSRKIIQLTEQTKASFNLRHNRNRLFQLKCVSYLVISSIGEGFVSKQTATRKLTTIFYADVVGYSRLIGDDELRTHQEVMDVLDYSNTTIGAMGGTV